METFLTRKMEHRDLKEVLYIYKEGIDTGMAPLKQMYQVNNYGMKDIMQLCAL